MRWQWYSDVAFELSPYWFERNRYPRGVPLSQRPHADVNAYEYGFDEQGRIAVLREYSGFLHGKLSYETTWTYRDDVVVEESAGRYTHRFSYADGLLRAQEMTARAGSGTETYTYTGDLVTGIDVTHNGRPWQTVRITHEDGVLQRIETTWLQGRSHTETTYRRPPHGFTLAKQADLVAELLVPWVVAEMEQFEAEEPVYCLALSYEDHSCLPELGVGLASEYKDLGRDRWNPAEFNYYGWDAEPVGPELAEAADLLDQEAALRGDHAVHRGLLNAVAQRLNAHDWSQVLPTTPDFVVYATDVHLNDLDDNLKLAQATRPRSASAL